MNMQVVGSENRMYNVIEREHKLAHPIRPTENISVQLGISDDIHTWLEICPSKPLIGLPAAYGWGSLQRSSIPCSRGSHFAAKRK